MTDGSHEMRFGESWDPDPMAKYYSFQYKFKPQSATRNGRGAVQIEQTNGQCAALPEGQDCIAILEDGVWRLELLTAAATNMRVIGNTGQHGGLTPASPKRPAQQAAPSGGSPRKVKQKAEEPVSQQQMPATAEASMTPSVSAQPSTTTASQDLSDSPMQPSSIRRTAASSQPTVGADRQGPHLTSSDGPLVPAPPVSEQLRSESAETSTSSSGSEAEVAQPVKQSTKASSAALASKGEMPDFEREFFQDSSEVESDSPSSDSNGNDSEEEAKHF